MPLYIKTKSYSVLVDDEWVQWEPGRVIKLTDGVNRLFAWLKKLCFPTLFSDLNCK